VAKQAQLDEVRPMLNEVNSVISSVDHALDTVEHGADVAVHAVEHGLEKVADVVPEAIDKTVHIAAETTRKGVRALQSPRKMLLLITLGGAVAGAGIGVLAYHLQKKRIESKVRAEYEEKLNSEIEAMQKFYSTRAEKRAKRAQPHDTPEEAVKARISEEGKAAIEAAKALSEYEGEQPPGVVDEDPREGRNHRTRYDRVRPRKNLTEKAAENPTEAINREEPTGATVVRNVFTDAVEIPGWNQEAEEASRHPESPYVISYLEYNENAYEHEQNSITYYKKDDLLADERDHVLDNVEAIVGVENLHLFGHGSLDPNVVYIRNERMEVDFEVTQRDVSYAELVGGVGQ
jgi:hypothetical protein